MKVENALSAYVKLRTAERQAKKSARFRGLGMQGYRVGGLGLEFYG